MLILLIMMAVAGLAVAVIALRADSDDSVPSKDKASMRTPLMSSPSTPTAGPGIPKEPKKNPLSMLTQMFKKKPQTTPLTGSSAVPKKNPLSMVTDIFKKK